MNKSYFLQIFEKIFEVHGKASPSSGKADAVYKRISDFPDGLMDFALAKLEDYDSLPGNLGKEFRRVLWPRYVEKHPELRARIQSSYCDNCRDGDAGVPGWFFVWDITGKEALSKCVCNDTESVRHIPGRTRKEMCDLGFFVEQPAQILKHNEALEFLRDNPAPNFRSVRSAA